MMRYTGTLCAGLGLLWFGPGFAQETTSPTQGRSEDPLTNAWFDTVQSIGVLEGLSRQLDVSRPGAVENLRRNTESPIGDPDQRQAKLDDLELEIARLRSELELLNAKPEPAPAQTADAGPRAPQVATRTVGLSEQSRDDMLRDADQRERLARALDPGTTTAVEQEAIEQPDPTPERFTEYRSDSDDRLAQIAAELEALRTREREMAAELAASRAEVEALRAQNTPQSANPTEVPVQPPVIDPEIPALESVDTNPPFRSEMDERLALLEAELARLSAERTQPTTTEPVSTDSNSTEPLVLPPATDDSALNAESLPTTLVLGPLDGVAPTNLPTADPVSTDPLQNGGFAPTDAGTLPVTDRVERAQAIAEQQAEAERQRVASAMSVDGYSADPVRQGRAAYFAGDYERSVMLLASYPDRLDAVYWQGRSLEKLDRVQEALKAYQLVAESEDGGELADRARLDLDFLQWKWEHNEAFEALRSNLEARQDG